MWICVAHCRRTSNALYALVALVRCKQKRFQLFSETVSADGRVSRVLWQWVPNRRACDRKSPSLEWLLRTVDLLARRRLRKTGQRSRIRTSWGRWLKTVAAGSSSLSAPWRPSLSQDVADVISRGRRVRLERTALVIGRPLMPSHRPLTSSTLLQTLTPGELLSPYLLIYLFILLCLSTTWTLSLYFIIINECN